MSDKVTTLIDKYRKSNEQKLEIIELKKKFRDLKLEIIELAESLSIQEVKELQNRNTEIHAGLTEEQKSLLKRYKDYR